MGTPEYMAPEQFRGHVTDARSDQFSFCVALYEGLYGERPFPGDEWAVLSLAVESGQIRQVPRDASVPQRVREVLVKGLSVKPEDRFPSMEALLQALTPPPSRRRRWGLTAAISAIVTTAVVVGVQQLRAIDQEAHRCVDEAQQLLGVWSDARKTSVHQAFAATQKPFAEDAWQHASASIDRYTASWQAAFVSSCEATRAQAEAQTSTTMTDGFRVDPRECLQRRYDELRALTDLFAQADAQVVEHAVRSSDELTPVDVCLPQNEHARLDGNADTNSNANTTASASGDANNRPKPSGDLSQVRDDLRVKLARAQVLEGAGKYPEALAQAKEIRASARDLSLPAIEAEALLLIGESEVGQGGVLAEVTLAMRDAARAAEAARQDEIAAKARIKLVAALTNETRYADADEAGRDALAALKRIGVPPGLEAQLDGALGDLYERQGRYKDALALLQRAKNLIEQAVGSERPETAQALTSLSNLLVDQGQYDEGRKYIEQALSIDQKALGPSHPDMVGPLVSLGIVLARQNQHQAALSVFERALSITERSLGADSPAVAAPLDDVAEMLERLGRYQEALPQYQRVLELTEKTSGIDNPDVADPLTGIARAHLASKHPELAVPLLERALLLREKRPGERANIADTRFVLAKALWEAKQDRARARQLAKQSRDDFARGEGDKEALDEVDNWLSSHRP
jgi:tetratricopeptide (TPR) repeat protein